VNVRWVATFGDAPSGVVLCLQVFNFGTVVADLEKDSQNQGVSANIKITNISKVPCIVELATKTSSKAAVDSFPFGVKPAQLAIPALEHRFAQLLFHPKQIDSFVGGFEAEVQNGQGCPGSHRFACELRVRAIQIANS
jgi:hypothetical protein